MEITNKSRWFSRDLFKVLELVDGKSSVAEIFAKSDKLSDSKLKHAMEKLAREGFIKARESGPQTMFGDDLGFPATINVSEADTQAFLDAQAFVKDRYKAISEKGEWNKELKDLKKEIEQETTPKVDDKTYELIQATPLGKAEKNVEVKAGIGNETEAKATAQVGQRLADEKKAIIEATEMARRKIEQLAEAKQLAKSNATVDVTAKSKPEHGKLDWEDALNLAEAEERAKEVLEERFKTEDRLKKRLEARAREEAEEIARAEADEKAKREAIERAKAEAVARIKAEAEAKARTEAVAKARAEAEEQAKREAAERARAEEAARVKVEAEAKARAEAEAKSRAEAEEKAKREAIERVKAEAVARIKAEAEAKARAEAEAKAMAEAEEQAKREAEERARIEEAARVKAEAEAKARAEAEAKAMAEAEEQAKREAAERARAEEAARVKAEAEAKARAEAEAKATAEAEEQAKREAAERAKAEEAARVKAGAEAKARAEAEAKARAEAEEQAKREAAERARIEEVARVKAEAEAAARAEAEAKARIEAEVLAKALAEEQARQAVEQKAREEAEKTAKAEAERRAKQEAEERAKAEAEECERREVADRARTEEAKRIKAEAEARASEAAEVLAHAKAEAAEQARREAEQQARIEAEAKEKNEAMVRAEVEAEALERRNAEMRARALAEIKARENAENKNIPASPVRLNKKPIKWGKPFLITLAFMVILAMGLLHVITLNAYIPDLEKLASDRVHEPVTIQTVRASLWPSPHLVLDGVMLGKLRDVKIDTVSVWPDMRSLLGDAKALKKIEFKDVTLDQDALPRIPLWFEEKGAHSLQVRRVNLKNVKLGVRNIQLPLFDAELRLGNDGAFRSALVQSTDGKLKATITSGNGDFQVDFIAKNWEPPFGPKLVFDELAGKAQTAGHELHISEWVGKLYGGSAKGTSLLSWKDQWRFSGELSASRVELHSLVPVFTQDISLRGALDGKVNYAMQAPTPDKLFDAPKVQVDFNIQDGALGGIDLVRALNSSENGGSGGGQTRFEKLSGSWFFAGNRYQFKQLKLVSGLLNANGYASLASNKHLSGRVNAQLGSRENRMSARLIMSGSLRDPIMRPGS